MHINTTTKLSVETFFVSLDTNHIVYTVLKGMAKVVIGILHIMFKMVAERNKNYSVYTYTSKNKHV